MAMAIDQNPALALPAGFARNIRLALFAVIGFLGVLCLSTPLVLSKAVAFSPFWFYGLILLTLALIGIAADRSGRNGIAIGLLYFLMFDLALAATTRLGSALKLTANLMPEMKRPMLKPTGFERHPLLQIKLTPNYDFQGYRHTDKGTRVVAEAKNASARPINVSLVGGSSTYDIDLRQGETWPDRLQEDLGQFRFWNWGVPSYTTVAHVTQTAWYLPEVGTECAIYYIGWNDIRNANLPALDPAYAEFHLRDLAKYGRDLTDNAPMASARLLSLINWLLSAPPVPPYYATVKPSQGLDERFKTYYARNIESLIALNRERGVKVGFIGQLLNYPELLKQPEGQRAFAAPGVQDRDIPAVMDMANDLLAATAARNHVPYLAPGQDWLSGSDYTDFGHFSEVGARKFARHVAGFISDSCARN